MVKKLSKKSVDFIELFLKCDNLTHITLSKHDVRILYDFYKNAIPLMLSIQMGNNNLLDELTIEMCKKGSVKDGLH